MVYLLVPLRVYSPCFHFGDFISVLSLLTPRELDAGILDHVEGRCEEFTGEMPLKDSYTATDYQECE
jgi:hypothetical protein